jgi:hypothetical protein
MPMLRTTSMAFSREGGGPVPAKANGIITPAEARVLLKDESSMKSTILLLQIVTGDRKDDPRLAAPQSDR